MNIKKYMELFLALLLTQPIGIALAQNTHYEQKVPLVINAGSGMILNSSALAHKDNNDVLQSFNKKNVSNKPSQHYYRNTPANVTNVVFITNNIVNSNEIIVQTYVNDGMAYNTPVNSQIYILKSNGHCYKHKGSDDKGPRIRVSKRFCQAK